MAVLRLEATPQSIPPSLSHGQQAVNRYPKTQRGQVVIIAY